MRNSISETVAADPREAIAERGRAEGFDAIGFANAQAPEGARANLREFLAAGFHGDMGWMETTAERRADPQVLWPEAQSVIVLGLNYGPASDALVPARTSGAISVYAQGADYHDLIKKKLKRIAHWIAETYRADVKVFVDTAPVMEKPLAEAAGLGWQGKHTNLVSREFGSWLFLGSIFTTLRLSPSERGRDNCGSCRACLDICPTRAFPAPYRIDARRCISYLTIEHKGHIAREFREPIGNRIYGCDDCLAVCPWNKFATRARETAFHPSTDVSALAQLALLDDAAFRARFGGSPVKRIGRDRFVRNVLIAVGNSGATELAAVALRLITDPSPLVRAMAVWALARLLAPVDFQALAARFAAEEADEAVREEWRAACDAGLHDGSRRPSGSGPGPSRSRSAGPK